MQLTLRWLDPPDDDGVIAAAWWADPRGCLRFAGFYPVPAVAVDALVDGGAELGDDGAWEATIDVEHTVEVVSA